MKKRERILFIFLVILLVLIYMIMQGKGLYYTPQQIANIVAQRYQLSEFHRKLLLALILLESGARKINTTFYEQTKMMSERTIENCKHYNYLNYTYFKNTTYGIPNIYTDINFFSLEKFIEALGKIYIGISPRATFIQILTSSYSVIDFANKIKLYRFTKFRTDDEFQTYVKNLEYLYYSLA